MTTQLELFKPSPQPWRPHAYQKKSVKFLLEHACAGLFLDPGLGKTSISLAAIKVLKAKKLLDRVLLIAPLRVCYSVWTQEATKWEDFHGLRVELLHGPGKDQALRRDADIYLVNPEGLDWLMQTTKTRSPGGKVKVAVDLARWKKLGFDTLCIDELSKFKHVSSHRFKAMRAVLHTFKRRWGLTGSPAANGLLDLFGQCYMLDQGRSLGPYITHYRHTYFHQVGYGGFTYVPRAEAAQAIYERLSPLVLRMAAEDYLEMPTLIENTIKVELPAPVREFYDTLEDELIAAIEGNVVTAATAGVASGKCRQVANGGIYLTPELQVTGFKLPRQKRAWLNLHTEKVDALADLIDELQGAPLLVAYDFEHDLDRLKARFGEDLPYIGGGVPAKRAAELERLWNQGKLPYLFGHPQSIAHGLNLQDVGNHVAWHSLTWDFELYDQFIRRVRRQGNRHKRVFVHHLIAQDTVDDVILKALRAKHRGQQALFQGLKELAKVRRPKK